MAEAVRIVGEDELPEAARLPADFDPLADGILMEHQKRWIEDRSDLKLIPKGRRTGITFAEALDDALIVAAKRSAGGDNVYYIGDTKDKALEFIGVMAKFLGTVARELAVIEEFPFEDRRDDGESKFITAYRIRCASGFQAVGLSSRPENIRGLQGVVVIDEAAFHKNVRAVIDACNALLIWGGKIRIISTHNGEANPFNDLVEKARRGELPYSVHQVTFRDAVRNGLFERMCLRNGWEPTRARFFGWIRRIYRSYTDKEARDEELFAIPSKGSGVVLTRAMIKRCMTADYAVIRLTLPEGFERRPEAARVDFVDAWLEDNIKPLLGEFDPQLKSYFGQDFARSFNLSVIAPGQETRQLKLIVPFMLELDNVPFAQQQQILYYIIRRLPRFIAGTMDARGNGQMLAELAQQNFGFERIEAVMATDNWYGENMPLVVSTFEDGGILLPADDLIEEDLRQLKRIDGVIKLPKQTAGVGLAKRHGDGAIAVANFITAANRDVAPAEIHGSGDRRPAGNAFEEPGETMEAPIRNAGFGSVGGGLDFGEF